VRFLKAYVELTNACGQACHFCPSRPKQECVLSLVQFSAILTQLAPFTKRIALHVMGDPLMVSRLTDYLDEAHEKQMRVELTTSGFRLAHHHPSLMKHPALHQLNVSLNSASQVSASQQALYMKEVLAWATYKRLHAPSLFLNLRLWNQSGNASDEAFTAMILTSLCHYFEVESSFTCNVMQLAPKLRLHRAHYFQWPALAAPKVPHSFCHGLGSHVGILSDGRVVPCCLDGQGEMTLGNVFETSLEHILASKRARDIVAGFAQHRAIEPLCQRCGFRERFLNLHSIYTA
jgi:radical SAM protein with 4Fe4S-binding SPASM domain